jgi:hypothetical protein
MSSRRAIALIAGAATLLVGCLPAATASAAGQPSSAKAAIHPLGNVALPGVVETNPVTYTPNIFAGPVCGSTCSKFSTVYATVVVNGEVVVAGAFGEACTPAPASYAQCPTTVTTDDILAFNPATGAIDPNFNPTFTNGPIYSLAAGPNNTVYVGGSFTKVDGVSEEGVAQLNVAPGQSSDGTPVAGFDAYTSGVVNQIAYNGNALYIGGVFAMTDGVKTTGISRVNATTGALDTSFKFTLTDADGGALQVKTMALSPNGATLAIAGTFLQINHTSIPRLGLINTGGALGSTATLDNFAVPLLTNNCSKQHDYINGIDFSPDGSFFVIADTGFGSNGEPGICDSTARFNVSSTGTDVTPAWMNYTGGDSFRSVVVAGSVVYVGGHERWLNNECGNNHACEANTVLVEGIGAIDANTGLALPWWQPMTGRGRGVQSLATYPAGTFAGSNGGLLLGTDVSIISGATHDELAMFPLASAATPAAGGAILNGMFSQGRVGGLEETNTGIADMCVDDQGNGTSPGSVVDLATCNNSNQQNWTIGSGGTIQVNGLCLDTTGGATVPGTLLVLNTCDGATSQVWTQSTGNTVINQASSLCLDDPGSSTTSGTQLDINTCTGALSQSWPLPVAQASPAPPPVGPVYDAQVQSDDAVPCMTDYKGILTQGEKVIETACEGLTEQIWTLEPASTIEYKGKCLDTAGSGTASGTLVVLDKCTGVSSQVWTSASNYELVNQASGLCLTAPTDTSGTQLDIASCADGNNQQWRLPSL